MYSRYCLAAMALLCTTAAPVLSASRAQEHDAAKQAATSPELAEASRLSQQVVMLYNQGRFDEALPLAKRALELREKRLGGENQLVAVALKNLAGLYFGKKQYSEAMKLYQRALNAYQKTLGEDDPKVAEVLDNVAWSSYGIGDTGKAESSLQRALAIREKAFGSDSGEVGDSLFALAMFHQKSGRASKAVEFYKHAISIKEKTDGANSKELANLLQKCACALISTGRREEAAGMQLRAQMITHRPGPDSVVGPVIQGRATFRQEPVYPQAARHERISGSVIVEVTVDETGKVLEARSLCGPDLLVGASVEAARHWRFTPTLLSGKPVKVIGTITFNFNL